MLLSRNNLLWFCMIGMAGSLFVSRALLTIFMMLFIVLSFIHKDTRLQFRQFLSSPLLWSMSLLFFIPLISGLWSEDKKEWLSVIKIKLPLLLFPLAFAAPFTFSKKQWDWLAYIFIALVTTGTLWSIFHYTSDMQAINESYLRAKSLLTPLHNDHIRFSWLVSTATLLSGWMSWQQRKQNKSLSIILLLTGIWLIVFLHILAARTGLFSLYIMLFIAGTWLIIRKTRLITGMALLILLLSLPLLAYYTFPSFQNRVRYIRYDYGYFSEMNYLPGGNDAARVISIRAGINILQQYPLTGPGAGDIPAAVEKWDKENYPEILPSDIIYPSSEWLAYGLMAGWPGVLLFTMIMLVPFFIGGNDRLGWWMLHSTIAAAFIFDIGLEVQFGIFIYVFIVLWWWKWMFYKRNNFAT